MRRLAPAVLLLGTVPLLAPTVHAFGNPGGVSTHQLLKYAKQQHVTRRYTLDTGTSAIRAGVVLNHQIGGALLQARSSLSALHPSVLNGRRVLAARSAAPTAQQAAQLRVDPSAFTPATVDIDGPEDNATADKNYFASNHSTTYENLKRVTGYYERANVNNTILFRYQGSIFQDAASASNALQDGVTATTAAYKAPAPSDCKVSVTCYLLGYGVSVNNQSMFELYGIAAYNQCLTEVTGTAPSNITDASNADALKGFGLVVGNILDAGIAAMKSACGTAGTTSPTAGTGGTAGPVTVSPTPTPTVGPQPTATPSPVPTQATTDFSVDAVKVQASSKDTSKVLKSMKTGKKAYLFIYWTVNSARPGVKPSYNYKGTLGGKSVLHGKFKGGLSSYDPGGYEASFRFTAKNAGKYSFTGTVTFDGQKHQAKTTLKVTK